MHFAECPQCFQEHQRFQKSLDALQSVSTASLPSGHTSLWPRLVNVLKEMPRQRDHFNGWIPAAAMALAAALMIAVSVTQVRREMGRSSPVTWRPGTPSSSENRNLFATDKRFAPGFVDRDEVPVEGLVVQPENGASEHHW